MYVIIDHFDSFTYNLAQMLSGIVCGEVRVIRSDAYTPEELEALPMKGLILSAGPGSPDEYPASLETVRRFTGRVPMLGVGLGHELAAAAHGGGIRRGKRVMHGKADEMLTDGRGCFRNIPSPSSFMRYHSLVVEPETLPDCFEISAQSRRDGDIMAIRHKECVLEGVQFHPESIGSESGRRVLENFVNYRREPFLGRQVLDRLIKGENLERETARAFMLEMAEGNMTNARLAGFLCALEAKGVTAAEIAGCVSVLADKCVPFVTDLPVLDIVGIGGDGKGSFNLSSMAAITAAACGQPIAKHGNRAVSSFCGSADFYAQLGFPLAISPAKAERLLADTGFVFLFAPLYHSAMKYAVATRRELAVRTIMNILGPIASPAHARYQVLGVPEEKLLRPLAEAAIMLGGERVMTLRSEDGLDEFSCAAPTRYVMAEAGGGITEHAFDPAEAGIRGFDSDALKGGTAEDNAAIAMRLASGEERGGVLDAVCLNAGAGLFVSGKAESIASGYAKAMEAFASGKVKAKLDEVIARANQLVEQ